MSISTLHKGDDDDNNNNINGNVELQLLQSSPDYPAIRITEGYSFRMDVSV